MSIKRAALYDDARKNMGEKCTLFESLGVQNLSNEDRAKLRQMVVDYDAFTPETDPSGEHMAGSVRMRGVEYVWSFTRYPDMLALTITRGDERALSDL